MKHPNWPLPLLLCLATQSAQAIQMTDYKDPESVAEQAVLQGSFNTRSGNQDQTSYNVNVNVDYNFDYSSLPRTWGLELDGGGTISRAASTDSRTEDNSNAAFSAYVNNYFKSRPDNFWYGDTDVNYRSEAERARIEVSAGLGYGRVILATPLAKVLRIEEELREHGVILGRMADAVYLELAQILARESQYISEHGLEEYRAFWIADFEAVLKREGLLRDEALGAIGVLQMDRVLVDEFFSDRKHGWKVGAGFGSLIQDFDSERSDPSFSAFYEYARPSGYKGQFINRMDYSASLSSDNDQYITNVMSYSHEISDRIDWVNSWNMNWQIFGDQRADIVENAMVTTFRYYVTNRITADVDLVIRKLDDGIDNNGNEDVSVATFGTIRYRLK